MSDTIDNQVRKAMQYALAVEKGASMARGEFGNSAQSFSNFNAGKGFSGASTPSGTSSVPTSDPVSSISKIVGNIASFFA